MPFVSEKQRKYMYKFHTDIAKRWTDKYGSEPLTRRMKRKNKK